MDLLDKIFQAGIVGCGGAGFPTHVKLKAHPEYFIINGAECEPLLRTDRYIMINLADKIVAGADAICENLNIPKAFIALKAHYHEERRTLEKAIQKAGSKLQIHLMESFYPAGDEQVMVYEVTGKVVPPAGIPLDVGAVVDNVATVLAVADAVLGQPFTYKYLTVTGEVAKPTVLHVPVGTSFKRCIELAGGALMDHYTIVSGGPMMGKYMSKEDGLKAHVTKTTSGILILSDQSRTAAAHQVDVRHMLNRARSACIQCSYCTQLCPRHLLGHPLKPHKIMRKMALCDHISDLLDDMDIRQAAICCECGICEVYACPMGLQPRTINGLLKGELSRAGIRYERTGDSWTPLDDRPYRKAPTDRTAARAGVLKYNDYEICQCIEDHPKDVEIPLKMNIGAPSVPVVSSGDYVSTGQLIAKCPEGKLGANICASIDGIVRLTDHSVIISG